jgi:hypothetical protein
MSSTMNGFGKTCCDCSLVDVVMDEPASHERLMGGVVGNPCGINDRRSTGSDSGSIGRAVEQFDGQRNAGRGRVVGQEVGNADADRRVGGEGEVVRVGHRREAGSGRRRFRAARRQDGFAPCYLTEAHDRRQANQHRPARRVAAPATASTLGIGLSAFSRNRGKACGCSTVPGAFRGAFVDGGELIVDAGRQQGAALLGGGADVVIVLAVASVMTAE